MKKVFIIQPVMKAYRVPFFTGLAARLLGSDIRLEVLYGKPWKTEAKRGDHVSLQPPLGRQVASWMVFRKLLLQPVFVPLTTADLVIVEHANKHILNWLLYGLRLLRFKRIAYWGHGRDRQSDSDSVGEMFKRRSLHWVDWWFAYTKGAADYIGLQRFNRSRITVVENAIDTRGFRECLDSVSTEEKRELLANLGWAAESKVGIYCGSLYPNKRLDLLMEAATRVRASLTDFCLLIVGDGPNSKEVSEFAAMHPWVCFAGPQFGRTKALYFSIAKVALNPGLVGLGILDAFSAGLPFLTTDVPIHSPEIEYLEQGRNGMVLAPTEEEFAEGIVSLFSNPSLLRNLSVGARYSSERYSIETMVENFALGIEQCLAQ